MAIQHRRGADKDFDPQKMLPGEFAVTIDGTRKVYVAFAAGDVEELSTEETDTSLTKEGKAADAKATGEKIEQIKTDIYGNASIDDKLDILTENFNFTSGGYYDETNTLYSSGSTSYSQLVDISLYDEVSVIAGGDFWITFFDEASNFVTGKHIQDSVSLKKYTLDVSNYAYVRVSLFDTRISDFYFEGVVKGIIGKAGLKSEINEIKEDVSGLKSEINDVKEDVSVLKGELYAEGLKSELTSNFNFTSGGYYDETNTLYSSSSTSYSQLVDISEYDKITVVGGGDFWITFFDEASNFVIGKELKNSNPLNEHELETNNYSYVRVSIFNTRLTDFYFTGVKIAGLKGEINDVKEDVSGLKSEINDVKEDVSVLKGEINDVFFVSKDGSGQYTSLLEGLLAATEKMDCIVYVGSGTYNVVDEFKQYYGDAFFESYDGSNIGMVLKNRVHLIFSSDSVVIYEAPVDNLNLHSNFCVFNSGEYGFTLENATIISKKSRYAIHDERVGSKTPYVNKYINCNITCDNTESLTSAYPQAIGGGLGSCGYIYINGCIFDAKSAVNTAVSYHNHIADDSKSEIVFTNNYCKHGTFRVTYMGQSQKVTTALCCSNSFDIEPYIQAEVGVNAPYENMELFAFNNVVR